MLRKRGSSSSSPTNFVQWIVVMAAIAAVVYGAHEWWRRRRRAGSPSPLVRAASAAASAAAASAATASAVAAATAMQKKDKAMALTAAAATPAVAMADVTTDKKDKDTDAAYASVVASAEAEADRSVERFSERRVSPSPSSLATSMEVANRENDLYVYFDLAKENFLRDPLVGRVVCRLRPDVAPRTVDNFLQLVAAHKYDDTVFHRVVKDFMVQGGDLVNGNGTGTYTARGGAGTTFDDEPFVLKHDRPGTLSMANSGPNTNGSQFFITTALAPHLDGKHVVFGHVIKGLEYVHDLENELVDHEHRPIRRCYVHRAGVLAAASKAKKKKKNAAAAHDNNDAHLALDGRPRSSRQAVQ